MHAAGWPWPGSGDAKDKYILAKQPGNFGSGHPTAAACQTPEPNYEIAFSCQGKRPKPKSIPQTTPHGVESRFARAWKLHHGKTMRRWQQVAGLLPDRQMLGD